MLSKGMVEVFGVGVTVIGEGDTTDGDTAADGLGSEPYSTVVSDDFPRNKKYPPTSTIAIRTTVHTHENPRSFVMFCFIDLQHSGYFIRCEESLYPVFIAP